MDLKEVLPNGETSLKMKEVNGVEGELSAGSHPRDAVDDEQDGAHNPGLVIALINGVAILSVVAGLFLVTLIISGDSEPFYLPTAIGSVFGGFLLFGFASVITLLKEIRDKP